MRVTQLCQTKIKLYRYVEQLGKYFEGLLQKRTLCLWTYDNKRIPGNTHSPLTKARAAFLCILARLSALHFFVGANWQDRRETAEQ